MATNRRMPGTEATGYRQEDPLPSGKVKREGAVGFHETNPGISRK
jgi:hypothetical protein